MWGVVHRKEDPSRDLHKKTDTRKRAKAPPVGQVRWCRVVDQVVIQGCDQRLLQEGKPTHRKEKV
eukprot:5810090-Pleurochrysis_carterae.AAC.1